jgi:hypothetical protein
LRAGDHCTPDNGTDHGADRGGIRMAVGRGLASEGEASAEQGDLGETVKHDAPPEEPGEEPGIYETLASNES